MSTQSFNRPLLNKYLMCSNIAATTFILDPTAKVYIIPGKYPIIPLSIWCSERNHTKFSHFYPYFHLQAKTFLLSILENTKVAYQILSLKSMQFYCKLFTISYLLNSSPIYLSTSAIHGHFCCCFGFPMLFKEGKG
jgi:hypothetical protein